MLELVLAVMFMLPVDDSDNYREVTVTVGQETLHIIVPVEQEADLTAELFRATGAVNYPRHEAPRDEFGDRVPENVREEP